MRVTVDLAPELVWKLTAEAERRGVTTGEVVAQMVATTLDPLEFTNRIRSRVLAKLSDSEIARELNVPNQTVSAARRKMGLPANRIQGR